MAKIIQINNDIVTVGMDNGSLTEVRMCDLNFTPNVNDEVEIFQNEAKTIVSKKEAPKQNEIPGGININVNNSNTVGSQPVTTTNGKKAVNKVVYCLLAFFLGGIGVHKFYSGKIGLGILYLVFCWTYIPLIASLIEFIMALCKKADDNGMIIV